MTKPTYTLPKTDNEIINLTEKDVDEKSLIDAYDVLIAFDEHSLKALPSNHQTILMQKAKRGDLGFFLIGRGKTIDALLTKSFDIYPQLSDLLIIRRGYLQDKQTTLMIEKTLAQEEERTPSHFQQVLESENMQGYFNQFGTFVFGSRPTNKFEQLSRTFIHVEHTQDTLSIPSLTRNPPLTITRVGTYQVLEGSPSASNEVANSTQYSISLRTEVRAPSINALLSQKQNNQSLYFGEHTNSGPSYSGFFIGGLDTTCSSNDTKFTVTRTAPYNTTGDFESTSTYANSSFTEQTKTSSTSYTNSISLGGSGGYFGVLFGAFDASFSTSVEHTSTISNYTQDTTSINSTVSQYKYTVFTTNLEQKPDTDSYTVTWKNDAGKLMPELFDGAITNNNSYEVSRAGYRTDNCVENFDPLNNNPALITPNPFQSTVVWNTKPNISTPQTTNLSSNANVYYGYASSENACSYHLIKKSHPKTLSFNWSTFAIPSIGGFSQQIDSSQFGFIPFSHGYQCVLLRISLAPGGFILEKTPIFLSFNISRDTPEFVPNLSLSSYLIAQAVKCSSNPEGNTYKFPAPLENEYYDILLDKLIYMPSKPYAFAAHAPNSSNEAKAPLYFLDGQKEAVFALFVPYVDPTESFNLVVNAWLRASETDIWKTSSQKLLVSTPTMGSQTTRERGSCP